MGKEKKKQRKENQKLNDDVDEEEKEASVGTELENSNTQCDQNDTTEYEEMDLDEAIPEWENSDNEGTNKIEDTPAPEEPTGYTILGEPEFIKVQKIAVTSSWIENATIFPAELAEKNYCKITAVKGLPSSMVDKLQERIKSWFPVQKSVLPILLQDIEHPPILRPRDITISAPTGSGKTLCYIIPAIATAGECPPGRLSSLIVVPNQALVRQIEAEFQRFNVFECKVVSLISNTVEKDFIRLINLENNLFNTDIIITTPAKLVECLTHPDNIIRFTHLKYLIVDEADRMGNKTRLEWLDLVESRSSGSFRPTNITDILSTRSAPRKILLSATISKDVEELHMWKLFRPCLFRANATSSEQVVAPVLDHITGRLALPATIKHKIIMAEKRIHPLVLYNVIEKSEFKKILVFTNEKTSAVRLCRLLQHMVENRYSVENITSNLHSAKRAKLLSKFIKNDIRILICSDMLARGVDVPNIDCVVNYDLPPDDRLFVHRAGRTGRAGLDGTVLSIADKDQRRRFIKMLTKTSLIDGASQEEVTETEYGPLMETYQTGLLKLQGDLVVKGGKDVGNSTVSGFEYRRNRKWNPALREEREAERAKLRAKWKGKNKTKTN